MSETEPGAYDRGVIAGAIEARLAGHDRHFDSINGSLARIADELRGLADQLHTLSLAVQLLGTQAVARDATVVTTAAALKDADEARRNVSERGWSPWARGLAVLAAAVGVVGLFLILRGP